MWKQQKLFITYVPSRKEWYFMYDVRKNRIKKIAIIITILLVVILVISIGAQVILKGEHNQNKEVKTLKERNTIYLWYN